MGLIPILLLIAIVLLLTRSKGRPFRISATNVRDPIHLILLVVVVLLLVGLLVNLTAPLGVYRSW